VGEIEKFDIRHQRKNIIFLDTSDESDHQEGFLNQEMPQFNAMTMKFAKGIKNQMQANKKTPKYQNQIDVERQK
jgi:hypothetical protein